MAFSTVFAGLSQAFAAGFDYMLHANDYTKSGKELAAYVAGDFPEAEKAPNLSVFDAGDWGTFRDFKYKEGANDAKFAVVWDSEAAYICLLTGDKTNDYPGESDQSQSDGMYLFMSGTGESFTHSNITSTNHAVKMWMQMNKGTDAINTGFSAGGSVKGKKVPAITNPIKTITVNHITDQMDKYGSIWTYKLPWKEFFGMDAAPCAGDKFSFDIVYQDKQGDLAKKKQYSAVKFVSGLGCDVSEANGNVWTLAILVSIQQHIQF